MRKAAKPTLTPDEIALKTWKTRAEKRLIDLKDRTARGDFSKKVRKVMPMDTEALKTKAALEAAKLEFDQANHKAMTANAPWWVKTMDVAQKYRRWAVLTSVTVFEKLAAAAACDEKPHRCADQGADPPPAVRASEATATRLSRPRAFHRSPPRAACEEWPPYAPGVGLDCSHPKLRPDYSAHSRAPPHCRLSAEMREALLAPWRARRRRQASQGMPGSVALPAPTWQTPQLRSSGSVPPYRRRRYSHPGQ